MTYGSVCSGIEAATVAWGPLGWKPAWFAEVEPFPSAVLRHHYPKIPNHGDFTKIRDSGPIDILVGGTPCQSFSLAGKRAGVDDPRGVLAFEFLRLAARLKPRWVVFENVPGLLSSDGGRDFGAFLGELGKCGYGVAYRVLDAQYFGVPQRRRRVFVVGCLGSWRLAAAVLFEFHCLQGYSPPSREEGPGVAALTANGAGTCGADDNQGQAGHLIVNARQDPITSDVAQPLDQDGVSQAITFAERSRERGRNFEMSEEKSFALGDAGSGGTQHSARLFDGAAVRRLTPIECERLQGFADGYTAVPYRGKPAADGPRYRAIGNSMAVPVMRWLGSRIHAAS